LSGSCTAGSNQELVATRVNFEDLTGNHLSSASSRCFLPGVPTAEVAGKIRQCPHAPQPEEGNDNSSWNTFQLPGFFFPEPT
jgi:hypothetical protein